MSEDGVHNAEEPTVTVQGEGALQQTVERHPAYGQIAANRVTGGAGSHLYGSDFRHVAFVTITIEESELHRSLNYDRPFAKKRIIEVALSEAQWATFVSSPNAGGGTQCTLRWHRDIGWYPAIERPINRRTQFLQEMVGEFKESLDELVALAKEIRESKTLSQVRKDVMLHHIAIIRAGLGGSEHGGLAWVEKQFDEHIENTLEKAKIEINAHITTTLQRVGATALESGEPPIALIEGPKEDA